MASPRAADLIGKEFHPAFYDRKVQKVLKSAKNAYLKFPSGTSVSREFQVMPILLFHLVAKTVDLCGYQESSKVVPKTKQSSRSFSLAVPPPNECIYEVFWEGYKYAPTLVARLLSAVTDYVMTPFWEWTKERLLEHQLIQDAARRLQLRSWTDVFTSLEKMQEIIAPSPVKSPPHILLMAQKLNDINKRRRKVLKLWQVHIAMFERVKNEPSQGLSPEIRSWLSVLHK